MQPMSAFKGQKIQSVTTTEISLQLAQSFPKSENSLHFDVVGKAIETVNYAGRDKMEHFLN